jgi:hypothetical protein
MLVEVEFFAIERANPDESGETGRVFKAPQQLHVEKNAVAAYFTGLGYVLAKDVKEVQPADLRPARIPDGQQTRLPL